jgi:WhiB family transcriptional regulator, redox-sensing transcriptional regulator
MTRLRNWRELAACRNAATAYYDPFFDETDKDELAAIAICRICHVQGECLAYAIGTGQSHGVWGGKPQRELRRLITLDRLGRAQGRRAWPRRRQQGRRRLVATTHYRKQRGGGAGG